MLTEEKEHASRSWKVANVLIYMHLAVAIAVFIGRFADLTSVENVTKERLMAERLQQKQETGETCVSCS